MLILKTLAPQPMHGYGIAQRLEQVSNDVFHINAGSLFVALQRLERTGLINSQWKATENSRRAKYYTLTKRGRKRLDSETKEWGSGRNRQNFGGIVTGHVVVQKVNKRYLFALSQESS
jgi:PadR family transcriptional regulator PadR